MNKQEIERLIELKLTPIKKDNMRILMELFETSKDIKSIIQILEYQNEINKINKNLIKIRR